MFVEGNSNIRSSDIDALVKFFATNENLSSLCYPRNVSPDNDQNLINTIIDKTFSSYPSDIKKASRVLNCFKNYNGLKNQDKKIISLVGNFVKN